jgi:hypothetical protein
LCSPLEVAWPTVTVRRQPAAGVTCEERGAACDTACPAASALIAALENT